MIEITFKDFYECAYTNDAPLNETYNVNPRKDKTPVSQREMERRKLLDKVYRDVFEKKK